MSVRGLLVGVVSPVVENNLRAEVASGSSAPLLLRVLASAYPNSSRIGWPVLSGFEAPSLVKRDSKGTPSAW